MVRSLLYERYRRKSIRAGFVVHHDNALDRRRRTRPSPGLSSTTAPWLSRPGGFVDPQDATGRRLEEALQTLSTATTLAPSFWSDPETGDGYRAGGETVTDPGRAQVARPMLDSATPPTRRIRRGAVYRIQKDERGEGRSSTPRRPRPYLGKPSERGAVIQIHRSQSPRTQAGCQPGSGFSLNLCPPDRIHAGHVNQRRSRGVDAALRGEVWAPKNYDGRYEGP